MLDELVDATPNCDVCMHPLEATGRIEAPHWSCPSCGAVSIAI